MKVWSICASISVTITDIWTKFGTEHKYHTINMPEWQNSHKLKIQDGGGRHLEFRKNVNNFGLDKDSLHQIISEDAPWPCGDDNVTKSQNRKLIRVTSSDKCLKYMCVDLSDYNRFFLTNLVQNTNTTLSVRRNSQIYIRPPSWISEKMSITLDWIKISRITIYKKMHHCHA